LRVFLFCVSVSHTLQYFYTASTGMERFPEFVAVGIVDGEQIDYYDSVSEKNVLKQTWMEGVRDENSITDIRRGAQQTFKANVGVAMQRFNQTRGVHVVQQMYGCEWDDDAKEVKGFMQYGYDGEDFIAFDLKTQTWIAPTPQAVITKHKWDNNKAKITQAEQYLNQICPEWLKKYVNYGSSSLLRTELPSVSLLQKTPSSPVSCHATGFYPHRAVMFWRKDGEELHEDVDQGEILPNHDETFQMSVDLSSVTPEDWGKYECVFQLSGVKEDIVIKLDKSVIKTNEEFPSAAVIGVVAGLLRRNQRQRGEEQKIVSPSDTSSSSAEAPVPN
uniref:Class I histocompatibility antigen, F10 alpha chain-like n=1 Tax=Seriola lalandi dorsalis TaxID=1841481 RepID=A0A3B4YU26_SERLL